ncbi:MAG: HD domain-containing protein [Nitrospirae bacterium]|nr:HD domain-containing protein [Nitrospirota bacterium]
MKGREPLQRLAVYVSLMGWVILLLYVLVVYVHGQRQFSQFVEEFLSSELMGFRFRALILFAPFLTTIMGYLISERVKFVKKTLEIEGKLERALTNWRETFDSMPYGVMVIDSDSNILKANEYIARLYSLPVKELIGRKCYQVVHGRESEIKGCPLKVSLKTLETESLEYYDKRLNLWFLLHSTPLVSDEGIAYVHSIVDITELKDKEKRLIEGKSAFFNMLKDLDVSYKELKLLFDGLVFAFVDVIDAKSPWTKGHSERVTLYAVAIAKEMELSEKDIETLRIASILHDIGKIGTYDKILEKPDKLTEEEFNLVKQHPKKGSELLRHIKPLEDVIPIIRHHHEKLDGSGYVDGLKGDEIPLLSRIVCVSDSYDSMTSDRPYRPAPGKGYAISELKRCSGTQFDPIVVSAFIKILS